VKSIGCEYDYAENIMASTRVWEIRMSNNVGPGRSLDGR
jgi:hypothetical protein